MSQFDGSFAEGPRVGRASAVDEGLRAYMMRVYNYMAGGIFLTGVVAYLTYLAAVAQRADSGAPVLTPFGQMVYGSPLRWIVMLAPLVSVFFLSVRINKLSVGVTQFCFWLFSALMGLSLSSIFLVYTGESITRVFFVTAAAFAALSLYGYTTKRDLSAWGTFLVMGVVGIILAGLVNLWLQSSALQFALSVIGVLVFAGLTAYDTQRIKGVYYEVLHDISATSKATIMGALSLYLDFINMFIMMLSLFGRRH
jgi:FtsH-binding integral membrane protein